MLDARPSLLRFLLPRWTHGVYSPDGWAYTNSTVLDRDWVWIERNSMVKLRDRLLSISYLHRTRDARGFICCQAAVNVGQSVRHPL